MDTAGTTTLICQSCGMPLAKDEDKGSNSDGSKNGEYCRFCYKNGAFSDPDFTVYDMAQHVCQVITAKDAIPEAKALIIAKDKLSSLKRWLKD